MIEKMTSAISSTSPSPTSHMEDTLGSWAKLKSVYQKGHVDLEGENLDIASVVAVARKGCSAQISSKPEVAQKVRAGVKTLNEYLDKGYSIYGVNTGFGGSADTRTSDVVRLQQSLLQLTQSGILTSTDFVRRLGDYNWGSHAMPVTWVRATMLVRCNHLLRGHSGVRLEIVDALLKLLRMGLTPIVPLRGSISASGDLMPLSYLVGVLEGNPDIQVHWDRQPEAQIVSTSTALKVAGLEPFVLGPKEGLGLINGAAASAAVGSLAVHEANQLVLLAQSLTGMTCEAMLGNAENYHEFPAKIRPHPGQIEVAANIRKGLNGSRMVETSAAKDHFRQGLFQDRYALRGASQWLGPVVEDLKLAVQQITTELNSTQDNPVIDSESGEIYFCCNFQAASVSTAMAKTREGLQMVGKLLFSYSSELINPDLNKGLPANLAADDPSLSFTMKGVDINMAAYMSELGFLANSVTSHVQSAEMNNQPINSLAFISARYTLQAVELVSMMSAAHLYVTCQALDLRLLHETFLDGLQSVVQSALQTAFKSMDKDTAQRLQTKIMKSLRASWTATSREDLSVRIQALSTALTPILLAHTNELNTENPVSAIESAQKYITQEGRLLFEATRHRAFSGDLNVEPLLGRASRALYRFVRVDLGVPFHCGIWEHPTTDAEAAAGMPQRPRRTIGSWISIIYEAIRDGRICRPLAAGGEGLDGLNGSNGSARNA
ncbi:hypothetical protein CNMCM5793_006137 [Aspergillus hiratsukae]|uniref:Phenylalanine ammonia-lyase n=1 Tax=Aspergillus hiratsukae TaxID=1194566 RepID=A0A8H6U9P5_9EURO|nr:hypothetical protein CNMCM5793_006137 [Aspergillus hiratsukae]KAF7168604.1 hypothetical protein CNMCM6106_003763 [Aspergillus hiratsukae]